MNGSDGLPSAQKLNSREITLNLRYLLGSEAASVQKSGKPRMKIISLPHGQGWLEVNGQHLTAWCIGAGTKACVFGTCRLWFINLIKTSTRQRLQRNGSEGRSKSPSSPAERGD